MRQFGKFAAKAGLVIGQLPPIMPNRLRVMQLIPADEKDENKNKSICHSIYSSASFNLVNNGISGVKN